MADVKWIKITTDIFDDEKILLIESLPDSYAIITVWFKLLCLAGKQNNSGVFMMNNQIAYTNQMLATIFRMKEATVTMALQTFEQFGMVEIIDGVITIPNWGKHQNLDQLESKKEYMRNYMQEYRKKQRRLTGNSKLCESGLPTDEWVAVLDFFNRECAYCGAKDNLEQEHIIPVNDGGMYKIGNIVPSCRKCNASKGSKSVDSWYINSDVFNADRFQKINLYRCKTNIKDLHKANVRQADKEREKEEDIKNKSKKKNNKKEEALSLLNSLLPSFIFSDSVKSKMSEWVLYKAERKDFYTETGLKSLLRQVEKNCKTYGEHSVVDLIDDCMSSLYKGIIFDKLKTAKKDTPKEQTPTETPEFLKKWSV